ncbi:MAG: hypothetical protein ACKVIQ_12040, partial [Acidimicrobiales bacterium]
MADTPPQPPGWSDNQDPGVFPTPPDVPAYEPPPVTQPPAGAPQFLPPPQPAAAPYAAPTQAG